MVTGNTLVICDGSIFFLFFFSGSVVVAKFEYHQLPSELLLPITARLPFSSEKQKIITSPHLTSWEHDSQGNTQAQMAMEKFMVNQRMENHPWRAVLGSSSLALSITNHCPDQGRPYLWLLSSDWIIPILGVSENTQGAPGIGRNDHNRGWEEFRVLGLFLTLLGWSCRWGTYFLKSLISPESMVITRMWYFLWPVEAVSSRGSFAVGFSCPPLHKAVVLFALLHLVFSFFPQGSLKAEEDLDVTPGAWRLTGIPCASGDSKGNDLRSPPGVHAAAHLDGSPLLCSSGHFCSPGKHLVAWAFPLPGRPGTGPSVSSQSLLKSYNLWP